MTDWTAAACAGIDPELWFPQPGHRQDAERAKNICRTCPIRTACADYGLRQQYGIYGGLGEHERRETRRRKNIRLASLDDPTIDAIANRRGAEKKAVA